MNINKKMLLAMVAVLPIMISTVIFIEIINHNSSPNIPKLAKRYSFFSEKQVKDFIKKNKVEDWSISKIEKLLYLSDNPHLYASDLLEATIRNRIKTQLLTVKVNDKTYEPAAIFMSNRFESKYKLETDDTTHILEFPETYQAIILNTDVQIVVSSHNEYSGLPLRFYQGDLRAIIAEGYKNIKELPLKKNKILVEMGNSAQEQIVFTIIKGKNEHFYKKLFGL